MIRRFSRFNRPVNRFARRNNIHSYRPVSRFAHRNMRYAHNISRMAKKEYIISPAEDTRLKSGSVKKDCTVSVYEIQDGKVSMEETLLKLKKGQNITVTKEGTDDFLTVNDIKSASAYRFNSSARRNFRAAEKLEHLLPQGSGIDYDWLIEILDDNTILASNAWHYMGQTGMYLGSIPFTVEINTKGEIKGPKFEVAELANSELGMYIADELMFEDEENGQLSADEISDILEGEADSIADNIWQSFDIIGKQKLGQAVQQFIAENR